MAKFLQEPSLVVAESITGLLASDNAEYGLIAGRLVQGALKVNLFKQFGKELKDLREKGKIKEDYFASHNQQATLVELLKFIDDETPDEEVFKTIKAIFFKIISKNASE